jgi:hypothetical protein
MYVTPLPVAVDDIDTPSSLELPHDVMSLNQGGIDALINQHAADPWLMREEVGIVERKQRQRRFILTIAEYARGRLLVNPEDTPANRLVAKRVSYELMKVLRHRDAHINQDMPYILELVFTPTTHDIGAKRMAESWTPSVRKFLMRTSSNIGIIASYWLGCLVPDFR